MIRMIRIIPKLDTTLTGPDQVYEPGDFIPVRATPGSGGYDVRAAVDSPIGLNPGCTALVPLGFALDLSDEPGLCAFLMPRSGLGHKRGLVLGNLVGLIDNDYQGQVMASVWNRNNSRGVHDTIWIHPGMTIAQLVFLRPDILEVDVMPFGWEPGATARGVGGFGSTQKSL